MTDSIRRLLGRKADARQTEEELEAVKKRVQRQRRELAEKDREIRALEARLSGAADRRAAPTAENPDTATAGRDGALPDFVVVGAMKGGTTFFYRMLSQHPSVRPAGRKEVQFFDLGFHRGEGWYRSHFPPPGPGGENTITGEATPYYLFHPSAAGRMARLVPKARIIVLLRNPTDRAYSHYNHTVRAGFENLSFEDAVEIEQLRLRGEREKLVEDGRYNSFNHRWYSYLARGVYVDQLSTWAGLFGGERMLVMRSEDFFSNRAEVLDRALGFLGLPPWEFRERKPREKTRPERRYEPMSAATRARLDGYFEPHNRRLYEYLGEDFGW